MRRYYLFRRKGIYYAELVTQRGVKLSPKSTKTRNRDEAVEIALGWLKNGVPTGLAGKPKPVELVSDLPAILKAIRQADLDTGDAMTIVAALRERELVDFGVTKSGPGRERFIPFLSRFWDLEQSPYLKDKIAHGHRITQKYCREAGQKIEKHWGPFFGDTVTLNGVTRKELREFSIALHEKGLSSSTINNIMIVGTAALKWAFTERLIPIDPTEGLTTFTGEGKSRDVLTEEEIEALFRVEWQEKRAYIAALVSLTTGIRSGEVRALRQDSIRDDVLDVSWNWNDTEGLKCPKNGEPRRAPLLPEVRTLLLELLNESPWADQQENPFVFYSEKPDRPCSAELFRRNFLRAIETVGISIAGRKIDFHSFRHIYASRMADRMASDKVAKVTGHRSKAAAKIYQDHVTKRILTEAASEAAQEFGNILRFARREA
ncbi:MAG: tyrosine-type recombinase/integrase [Treponema sp.]|jgi:integrase|nr:tyrosine-type recombinase/integrase [Treponema sp.]